MLNFKAVIFFVLVFSLENGVQGLLDATGSGIKVTTENCGAEGSTVTIGSTKTINVLCAAYGSGFCATGGDGFISCLCFPGYTTAKEDKDQGVITCYPNDRCALQGTADCASQKNANGIAKVCTAIPLPSVTMADVLAQKSYNCDDAACKANDAADINPCNNNGDIKGICTGTSTTEYTCTCSSGYVFIGGTCIASCVQFDNVDSNPCNNQGDSASKCSPLTISTYVCQCSAGFYQSSGTCLDIDECASLYICKNGVCKNSAGSYSCSCNTGYRLSSSTCEDIDECASSSTCKSGGDTTASCLNTQGSYICFCTNGFSSKDGGCSRDDGNTGLQAVGAIISNFLVFLFLPILIPFSLFAQIFTGLSSKSQRRLLGSTSGSTVTNLDASKLTSLLVKIQEIDWEKNDV